MTVAIQFEPNPAIVTDPRLRRFIADIQARVRIEQEADQAAADDRAGFAARAYASGQVAAYESFYAPFPGENVRSSSVTIVITVSSAVPYVEARQR